MYRPFSNDDLYTFKDADLIGIVFYSEDYSKE